MMEELANSETPAPNGTEQSVTSSVALLERFDTLSSQIEEKQKNIKEQQATLATLLDEREDVRKKIIERLQPILTVGTTKPDHARGSGETNLENLNEQDKSALQFVKANPGSTGHDIAKHLHVTYSSAYSRLANLTKSGLLRLERTAPNAPSRFYPA
jgi:predicted HTH transcriptional regulator